MSCKRKIIRNGVRLRILVLLTLSTFISSFCFFTPAMAAEPRPGETVGNDLTVDGVCLAPASSMWIREPSCLQQWEYHIYLVLISQQITSKAAVLTAKLRGEVADQVMRQKILDVADIASGMTAVFGTPDAAAAAFEAAPGVPKQLLGMYAVDGVTTENEKTELVGTGITMLGEVLKTSAGHAASAPSAAVGQGLKFAEILLNSYSIYKLHKLTVELNDLNVAAEYLMQFYKYGGSEIPIRKAYHLSGDSPRERIFDAIARRYGLSNGVIQKEYRVDDIERMTSEYKALMAKLVKACQRNRCALPPDEFVRKQTKEAYERKHNNWSRISSPVTVRRLVADKGPPGIVTAYVAFTVECIHSQCRDQGRMGRRITFIRKHKGWKLKSFQ